MNKTKKCKNCNKEFIAEYDEKYCSQKCYAQHQRRILRGEGMTMK